MLVLNLPFKALMFLTLMRPSLVLFLVLWLDRKSGSAGMPRPISYAVFCLKKKKEAKAVSTELREGEIGDDRQRQIREISRGRLLRHRHSGDEYSFEDRDER